MNSEAAEFSKWLLDQHFTGESFEDSLFNVDNEQREKACSWKIMSSVRYFGPLVNHTYRWKAVGIPLNLLDHSLQGDIDLLVAVLHEPKMENGHSVFPPPIYRCFELKTAKIAHNGDVKSLKSNKFYRTMGQLEKLCDLGSQQVFLLETFIVEAGYSNKGTGIMPLAVREAISKKYDQIMQADYGYVAMAIEQIPGYDERTTGLLWPTATIKRAKIREPTGPIGSIINTVETYATLANARGGSIITYCYVCCKLTHTRRNGPYFCRDCKTSFI